MLMVIVSVVVINLCKKRLSEYVILTTFWALRSLQSTAIYYFEIHCYIGHVCQAVKSGSFPRRSTVCVKVKLSLHRPGYTLGAVVRRDAQNF